MNKKIIQLNDHGLRELDHIVSGVLNAVEAEVRNRLGMEVTSDPAHVSQEGPDPLYSHDDAMGTDEEEWMQKSKKTGPQKTKSRKHPEMTGMDKARKESHAASSVVPGQWDHTSPELEIRLSHSDDMLFEKEEEAFITRAVSFLRQRENKDIIISRIWNHITEAEPNDFYSPDESEEDMADEISDDDAAEYSQTEDAPDPPDIEDDHPDDEGK